MLSRSLNNMSLLIATTAILLSSASISANDKLKVSGFVGLGIASTSDNNFLGDERASSSIIELGLGASYRVNNNMTFTGQVGHRRFAESFSDEKLRVDFASFNYFTNALNMGEQFISVGRVKVPSGFYNASRDVPSTRSSILLPQSVYLDIFRNSQLSVDGIQVNTTNELFNGLLSIDASIGSPQIDDNFSLAMFGGGAKGDWDIDLSKSINVTFENDTAILGMTYTRVEPEYSAEEGDRIIVVPGVFELPIVDGVIKLRTLIISARLNFGQVEWSNEYMYRKIIVDAFVEGRGPTDRPQEGYYTQLRYPFSENLSLFARWERFYRNANDKRRTRPRPVDVPLWAEITSSVSIGATYRISRNWQIAAEFHNVSGSAWLPPFFLPTPEATESKDWTLSAVQVSYRF
ncbi:MAG: hypothetical protein WA981_15265 [Glaciecola sp.]